VAETLNIQKEFDAIKSMYHADPRQGTFNALVLGTCGSGKTRLLSTCRKPVLVHSFDPGGSKTLRDGIAKGEILVDTRFEAEDYKRPSAYPAWEKEFERLTKLDIFSNIGTYAIDSLTLFSDACIHELLKKVGRAGGQMQKQDWGVFLNTIRDCLQAALNLPCDVVVTGHLNINKDETTGRTEAGVLIAGQSAERLPLLFDEMYIACAKEVAKGVEYNLVTANTGYYRAKTRIGNNKFDLYEKPDIKALLRKAGLPTEDKPLFNSAI
jgi:hypothetical protein